MKRFGLKALFTAGLFLMSAGPAMATIETIKGSLTCFVGCDKSVVQFVAQGESHSFEVVGQFVDLSTGVEITGSGVSVSYGTRRGGSSSSIIVKIDVGDAAAPGERTIKMRYAVETNGPDTFRVRVVRKGRIDQIQYSRRLPFQPGGGPARELVAPTNLPLNEKVVLVVTGTRLDDVQVRPQSAYRSARILPGATSGEVKIEMEFSSAGQHALQLFDSALSSQDMNSSTSSKFSYGGGAGRNIQFGGGGGAGGGSFVAPPLAGGGGGGNNTFVDAAPRANMLNVFRRQSQNAVFTENGVQYFGAPDGTPGFCSGMAGNQSRTVTVPNLTWGVSNVGTANINTPFVVELRSGGAVLARETVTALNAGETRNFTFARRNSQVRVFTFLTRNGCFVSPTANPFFEDPQFTVVVDPNNSLPEAAANRNNNTRNY